MSPIDIEIFAATLAALIVYRLLSPLIDAINPLNKIAAREPVCIDSSIGETVLFNVQRRQRDAAHEMFGKGSGTIEN